MSSLEKSKDQSVNEYHCVNVDETSRGKGGQEKGEKMGKPHTCTHAQKIQIINDNINQPTLVFPK